MVKRGNRKSEKLIRYQMPSIAIATDYRL